MELVMVAPITGPFTSTNVLTRRVTYPGGSPITVEVDSFYKSTHRQRKPFTEPLPCSRIRLIGAYENYSSPYSWQNYSFAFCDYGRGQPSQTELDSWATQARNKAYERFRAKVLDSASWAVTIAERRQAVSMMTARITQIHGAWKAVKRFNFYEAGRILGISRERVRRMSLRREAKALGSNWLEYWFGWAPLVGDVYGTMDILQKPFPYQTIKSSAKAFGKIVSVTTPSGWRNTTTVDWECVARLQAEALVSNPNLYLANQLGLVNPAVIALELVPYSWFVGWFVNLEAILSSWTDFLGLDLQRKSYSYRYKHKTTRLEVSPTVIYTWGTLGERYLRATGSIPGPVLRLSIPDRLSVTRGLTACALLVRNLKSA